jgi:hypothetical protein
MIKFSSSTKFYDVEGTPVTIDADGPGTPELYCAAWDTSPPRTFDPESARRNGAAITRAEFIQLAKLTDAA